MSKTEITIELLRQIAQRVEWLEWGVYLGSQSISDTDKESVYGVRINRENKHGEWRDD